MSETQNGYIDPHADCGSSVMPNETTRLGWGICAGCQEPRRLNVEADPVEETTQKNPGSRTGDLRTFADVGR